MIASRLLETGILQLGVFQTTHGMQPYRLRLELLPAYPELLSQVVEQLHATLTNDIPPTERLVAHADAVVIAGIVGHMLDMSLVYSQGRGEPPALDLAGAYDIGHPALLIVNTITDETKDFIAECQRVGLDIHTVVPIIGIGDTRIGKIQIKPVMRLSVLLNELEETGEITSSQADTLRQVL